MRSAAAPDAAVEGPLLEARRLALHAGERLLVDGLDLAVRAGERWCVIGRNGTGKSLLLRAFAGLPVPGRAGAVLWRGRAQADWPVGAAASLRALVPQQVQDRFALEVERVLALSEVAPAADLDVAAGAGTGSGTRVASGVDVAVGADARTRRRLRMLDALDVAHLAHRRADRLSGGERQRVALAQGALQGAAVLLLDEPVSFQDPAHQQLVGRWLAAWPPHAAWIASAHDPAWIARTATHVLALFGEADGAWLAGPVADVLTADVLQRTYGCPWRAVDGVWMAA